MLEPVSRDIAIDQRIGGNVGEPDEKNQTQNQGEGGRERKKPEVLAHQVAHPLNITCSGEISTSPSGKQSGIMPVSVCFGVPTFISLGKT